MVFPVFSTSAEILYLINSDASTEKNKRPGISQWIFKKDSS
jgi:hypothetical protein